MTSPITFTLELHGEAVELAAGRLWAETRGATATCRREVRLGDDGTLAETGELSFDGDSAVTFRAKGEVVASPDPRLRHGTAVCEVTGGRGRFAGARGFITTNFLLADSGELTDHHLGLLFV